MKAFLHRPVRAIGFLALVTALGMSPVDGPSPPDQVEEDWQLVVANPDPAVVGPQITTVMSPNSDPRAAFATFYVNYQDYPQWSPGGLQVKAYGPAPDPASPPPLLDTSDQGDNVCETRAETITWTQRLSLSGGNLNFSVVNGQSLTWGKFGQSNGTLGVSMPSALSDLGAYSPNYTMSKSGVSWQATRVTSMTLLQVRYYKGGQLLSTDSTPRNVNLTPGN
jgi:hypothetical protein